MPTIPFTDYRWCPKCGENVRVHGTEIIIKNASGKAERSKRGNDRRGHPFTY